MSAEGLLQTSDKFGRSNLGLAAAMWMKRTSALVSPANIIADSSQPSCLLKGSPVVGVCMKALSKTGLAGPTAMLLAMMLLPASDALSKHLVNSYSAEQIAFYRNAAHASALLPIVVVSYGWRSIWAEFNGIQLIRSLCFVLMTACYIVGLRWTPQAEAMAIVYLFPFLVLIGSVLFLKEHVKPGRWLAAILGFCGVIVVVAASFSAISGGLFWILAAAFSTAGYVLLTKQVSNRAPTLVLGFMPAFLGSALLLPPAALAWETLELTTSALMLLVGLIAAAAHFLIVYAYSKSDASLIAPLAYTQILTATLYGYIFFGDAPGTAVWFGIAIVLSGGLLLAFHERRSSLGATGRR